MTDETKTFEQILEALEGEVQKLEHGDLPIEQALESFESGVKLAKQGGEVLSAAEARVELLLRVEEDGTPVARPFEG